MERKVISPWDFAGRSFSIWEKSWFLLTAGDYASRRFNGMTVSWGSLGVMWGKPFAMIVARPQRYTFEFLNQFDTFTLCAFPLTLRMALERFGTRSGREIDKLNDPELVPMAATHVAAPVYQQAELAIECRKMYFDDYEPKNFLADFIAANYRRDYHRMFFGEVVAITATDQYLARP